VPEDQRASLIVNFEPQPDDAPKGRFDIVLAVVQAA